MRTSIEVKKYPQFWNTAFEVSKFLERKNYEFSFGVYKRSFLKLLRTNFKYAYKRKITWFWITFVNMNVHNNAVSKLPVKKLFSTVIYRNSKFLDTWCEEKKCFVLIICSITVKNRYRWIDVTRLSPIQQ